MQTNFKSKFRKFRNLSKIYLSS